MTISAFSIFFALLFIGKSIEKNNADYHALENDMIEIAQTYIDSDKLSVSIGNTIELKSSKMIEENLLSSMNVKDDTCDGYVNISRTYSGYTYKPYIKCNYYETYQD